MSSYGKLAISKLEIMIDSVCLNLKAFLLELNNGNKICSKELKELVS